MNLSHHALTSFSDDKWINEAILVMGEKQFWGYKRKVYYELETLSIGNTMHVESWCRPENYHLFIKIAHCFVSESKCCYEFNQDYTIIKRNDFNAREMDKTLALLDRIRREKAAERDGGGIEGESRGTEAVLAPKP